jgi:hypothetical protein
MDADVRDSFIGPNSSEHGNYMLRTHFVRVLSTYNCIPPQNGLTGAETCTCD